MNFSVIRVSPSAGGWWRRGAGLVTLVTSPAVIIKSSAINIMFIGHTAASRPASILTRHSLIYLLFIIGGTLTRDETAEAEMVYILDFF